MPDYLVTWTIDAEDVDNPVKAAQFAQRMQQRHRPGYWVGVFTVKNKETGVEEVIDLDELEGNFGGIDEEADQ